jgi:FG-GAP repeat
MRRILVYGVCAAVVSSGSVLALSSAVGSVSFPSGSGTVQADFDGDGFADLAVAVPEDNFAAPSHGEVNVIYGTSTGLTEARDQLWSQDSPGIEEVAEPDDLFGNSLAVADFDGDGFADLAVGVPGEDVAATNDGGVNVIYGSASGLTEAGDQFWSQDSPGIEEVAEPGDGFGYSLAAGDFDGDGFADLVVGVSGEDVSATNGGGVNVIHGSLSGLTEAGDQFWSQDSPGIKGTPGGDELFGFALAAADFDGDGFADLAGGVPNEDAAAANGGGVNVIYGSLSGLTEAGDQFWSQDSPGIKEVAGSSEALVFALAAADFGQSTHADLAVGVRGEDLASIDKAGGVNVIYGSASGLTEAADQFWSQDTPGIKGVAEPEDGFGFALAAADFGQSTHADLAVAVLGEDLAAIDQGGVNVIYGSASGLTEAADQFWSQDTPGIKGVAQPDDEFGFALAAADFGKGVHADLAGGVPNDDAAAANGGGVNVFYGSASGLTEAGDQFWSQDSPGIKGVAESGDRFGVTLAASST